MCITLAPWVSAQKGKESKQKRQNEIKAEYRTIKGMGKFLLEDYDEALKLFKEALQFSPDNAGIHFKIAETYFLQGVKSQAAVHVIKAIELDDDNESYYVLLANIRKSELRPSLAIMAYEKLLKKRPELADYYFELAELYSTLGNSYYQQKMELALSGNAKKGKGAKKLKKLEEMTDEYFNKALFALNQIEKKYGITEEVTTNKQLILMRQDKMEEAYKEGERLIEAHPDEPVYQIFQAELFQSNKEYERAVELLTKTTENHPRYGKANLLLYDLYKELDRDDLAIEQLKKAFQDPDVGVPEKASKLNPFLLSISQGNNKEIATELVNTLAEVHKDDPHALSVQGDFYRLIKDSQKARDTYQKVIELDKNNLSVWEKLVAYDLDINDHDRLIEHTEEALELFPNQPTLWLYNGIGYSYKKEYEKSISALEYGRNLASDLNMKNTFNAQLGDIYNDAKEYEKSDAAYEAVLSVDPNDPHVLNNYSYFLSLRGEKLELAKEMSKRLITNNPDDPTYLDTYGWVLFMVGEYEESKLVLAKAASKMEDGTIIEHYGDALFKTGETEKAVEQWQKAKKLGGTTENIDKKIEEKKYIP